MDRAKLHAWLNEIQVTNHPEADVEVANNSPLEMIGKGRQGAIFRISDDICMKVFGNQEDCDREHYALSLGADTGMFPRVFDKGALHIVLEYVKGVDLREYLLSQPLTPELSYKLIQMLHTFKRIGFERIDHHKRQIYLQPNGELKVIDVGRTVWRDRVYPYPRKLLNSLGDEHRSLFLSHVQSMAPELFQEWQYYIQLEQIAHGIYQQLMANPFDVNVSHIQELSRDLRTLSTAPVSTTHIEELLYKVFKEEWTVFAQDSKKNRDELVAIRDKIIEYKNRETELMRSEIELRRRDRTSSPSERWTKREQRQQFREERLQIRNQRYAMERAARLTAQQKLRELLHPLHEERLQPRHVRHVVQSGDNHPELLENQAHSKRVQPE